MSDQFHFHPEGYEETARAQVPGFDRLQAATVEAIPFAPQRVLELGIGTGVTTRALLSVYPDAAVTGLDSSPEMVFRARELGIEAVKLARMEDPLPDGPWDLVVSVLSVHHLDAERKRDLFRRVREQARAIVIGDVVSVEPERRVTPIGAELDFPDAAADLADWAGGEVVWESDDLAVIRAVYDSAEIA